MIIKSYELKKVVQNNALLFHGQNNGHKNELIDKIFKPFFKSNIFVYFEKEILSNSDEFYNSLTSKSFFEENKLIIIKEVTDNMRALVENIIEKNIDKITIILISNILEKKSKLRNFFEKDKNLISIPFYADNDETLRNAAVSFFKSKQISISFESINLIVNRSKGERENLNNELKKINSYIVNKKNISYIEIEKLICSNETTQINELIDNCLAKNTKKVINILNENIYTQEDAINILRTFLFKTKRLLSLVNDYSINKNIDQTISNSKPPIFWKEKELIKLQIKNWSLKQIHHLLNEINYSELYIKKNQNNAVFILNDLILGKSQ